MPLFCWFDHFLDFRAEILQIFQLLFWSIDDFINSFWLNLTFTKKFTAKLSDFIDKMAKALTTALVLLTILVAANAASQVKKSKLDTAMDGFDTFAKVDAPRAAKGIFNVDWKFHQIGQWFIEGTFSHMYGSTFWFVPLLPHVQFHFLSLNCLYLFSHMYSSIQICIPLSWPLLGSANTVQVWLGLGRLGLGRLG